ncbi:Exodeoxyribonuclease V beta chain (plasmid) [Rhodovastum atsumiense]|uniref:Uncharacterized protein n=1 Tax=Rhodovastum atsumiense TaxID=504468 RepID=A0A5M6ILN1_9PROT|nr:hypothetical protein [Rhodovastum atsumiense]KAA5608525.1 hypothetical protein F1189_28735 [Rhodovastum atsumiense]CAH2605803.1 Exodeoxyribonuclease V beta chain [Rhodovastum atsumiense]
MKLEALEEIRLKAATAYLIRQGASPGTVADLTGIAENFARRVARELDKQVRVRAPERLWTSRSMVLQGSLYGACLWRVLRSRREHDAVARMLAAYRLFRAFQDVIAPGRRDRLSAQHALSLYMAWQRGEISLRPCERCGLPNWHSQRVPRPACPVCQHVSIREAA